MTVRVEGCKVDMRRLRGDLERAAPGNPHVQSAIQVLVSSWDNDSEHRPTLLQLALDAFTKTPHEAADRVVVQMLLQLGLRLDSIVREEVGRAGGCEGDGKPIAHLVGKESLAVELDNSGSGHWRSRLRSCFSYHTAGLAEFCDLQEVSLSIDFARVSRKNMGSVAITNPAGVSYLPMPQVCRVHCGDWADIWSRQWDGVLNLRQGFTKVLGDNLQTPLVKFTSGRFFVFRKYRFFRFTNDRPADCVVLTNAICKFYVWPRPDPL